MKKKIPFSHILSIVSNYYKISEQEILQKGREEPACLIRQICQYLAYTLNNQQGFYTSLSEVGNYFGERKKGAVINSRRRIAEFMQVDKTLKASIEHLSKLICYEEQLCPILRNEKYSIIDKGRKSKQCWKCGKNIEKMEERVNHKLRYNQKIITLFFHIKCFDKYK